MFHRFGEHVVIRFLFSTRGSTIRQLVTGSVGFSFFAIFEWLYRGKPNYMILTLSVFNLILLTRALVLRRLDGDRGVLDTADERAFLAACQASYYSFWILLTTLFLLIFFFREQNMVAWTLVGVFSLALSIYVILEVSLRTGVKDREERIPL